MMTPPALGTVVENFKCPLCSAPMRWRAPRITPEKRFMGCEMYPDCTGSRNAEGIAGGISNVRVLSQIQRMLKAAVIASEDEVLTFSDSQLEDADKYDLHIEAIGEEKSHALTVRLKTP